MIDIENALFADIYALVKEKYPDADVTDEYEPTGAVFPKVTVLSRDEGEVVRLIDSSGVCVCANYFVEINVYATAETGFKAAAKAIVNTVCDRMKELGFTRTLCEPIPNQQASKIYRYVARFTAAVDRSGIIYRR